MKTVLDLMHWRRSVRSFEDTPLGDEVILDVLEAARWAPSSNNTQPWHFVVVKNHESISRIAEAVPAGPKRINAWITKAPLVIAVCGKPGIFVHRLGRIIDKDYHRIDVAISVAHLVLEATAKGVGTCIVGWFHRKKVGRLLKVPSGTEVVLLVVLGYPERQVETAVGIGGIPSRPRRPLEESVSWEEYGKTDR